MDKQKKNAMDKTIEIADKDVIIAMGCNRKGKGKYDASMVVYGRERELIDCFYNLTVSVAESVNMNIQELLATLFFMGCKEAIDKDEAEAMMP